MVEGQNMCHRNVQTISGNYPASYTRDSLRALPGAERPKCEA